uniref:Thiosulfate/3-mercaptopyruvate sulfurtransferase n=1 Tax=Candidatus Kentrum sp. TC TaxID=2126339 RepID=A0A450YMX8_9GAMM|nr:MAG: thiosulfate/3-mercaptopyruvate sulfurtransferase [Candidatus Kentron sp. TC]VFK42903.1 MAG: thiosulfate/3-mercaptopyruvate sulfurtransferase [Candidatus Kentron sp. TC]VFK57308.1 MAG: thiosulfate/3-mercaptopyruvate sulfurtransferase [Candidatus Kentron sp. TC]
MKIRKSPPEFRNSGGDKAPWSVAFLCLAWLVVGAPVSATTLPGPVVDGAWLARNLDKVVVLDVRKDVKSFAKKAKGATGPVNPCGPGGKKVRKPVRGDGHIPGAVLVDIRKILGKYKPKNGKTTIEYMAPKKEKFEKLMQKSGVNQDSAVVITGKGEKMIHTAFTTRLYWTLKYFGFDNAAILDGGVAGWKKDGNKAEFGKSRKPAKGNFKASEGRKEVRATMEEVVASSEGKGDAQILDVRDATFYLGLTYNRKLQSPKSKGHIPTAKNFPVVFFAETAGAPATLYDKEDIEKVAELSDIDLVGAPIVASCHSGVTATLAWFVISEVLGNKNARVYDGSMHEWSMTGKPVTRPLD